MTLADTNIVSTFARVEALALLRQLLEEERIFVVPGTYHELRRAVEVGCRFLEPVLTAIELGEGLDLVALMRKEILDVKNLPSSLGSGETESIAVCLHRRGSRFLTNDKRARNLCWEKQIPCLDLSAILRAFWVRKVLRKTEVRKLIVRIESEQGMVIKNKEQILQ